MTSPGWSPCSASGAKRVSSAIVVPLDHTTMSASAISACDQLDVAVEPRRRDHAVLRCREEPEEGAVFAVGDRRAALRFTPQADHRWGLRSSRRRHRRRRATSCSTRRPARSRDRPPTCPPAATIRSREWTSRGGRRSPTLPPRDDAAVMTEMRDVDGRASTPTSRAADRRHGRSWCSWSRCASSPASSGGG